MLKKRNKTVVNQEELKIYLRITWIRKFNQAILGTTLSVLVFIAIFTAINFSTYIFWPDILLSILFWLFIGSFFAYSLTGDALNPFKPSLTLFGNLFLAILIYQLTQVHFASFLGAFPIAYILFLILFLLMCAGAILTLITNTYILHFRRKYKNKNPELLKKSEPRKINLILVGSLIVMGYIFIALVFMIMYIPTVILTYFPIADELSIILFFVLCGLGSITLGVNIRIRYKQYKINNREKKLIHKVKLKHILVLLIILTGIPLSLLAIPGVLRVPITIEPKDYKINFALFAAYGNVSTPMGNNLNDHQVTLVFCCIPDVFNDTQKQGFVDTCTHYNNTYPNISLSIAHHGDPGGFLWDGNAEDAIRRAKEILNIAKEYNLTNIKGITFDIEPPIPAPGLDVSPNKTRHDDAITLWEGFFEWKRANAEDFSLIAVYFPEVGADIFDGDYDYHYLNKVVALELDSDEWAEHAPMIYRDAPYPDPPYGELSDGGSYFTYNRLNLMASVLEAKYGNYDDLGIYLFYKNGGCYNVVDCGYENIVRDTLIAKHFDVETVSIFMYDILNISYEWGCVFEHHGEDFLDRFNESVNGEASTQSFQIYYEPKLSFILNFGIMDMFFYDTLINFNSLIGVLLFSLFFGANITIAYYGWKKIKKKVINQSLIKNEKDINIKEKK